jgi:hypothetical protein
MNRPGPVVSRVQTPLAVASAPNYRLKVALPARFPQDAKPCGGLDSIQRDTRGKRRFPLEAGTIGGNMYLALYVQRVDATGWEDR